ncbi:MAG: dCTP deaminase, partial [Gaiellaceae bacterium]
MVLSDRTIQRLLAEGRIGVDPYDESLLQPSSVDVRVDRWFRVFHNARYPFIDVKQPQEELTELVEVDDETPFILHPGEFVLGSTLERIRLPDDLVARLEGKSSLGRLGLLIHSTAGFIDPGWDGHVTLELSNVANLPITIYYG